MSRSRCKDVAALEDLVAGRLPPTHAAELERHAAGCPRCAAEMRRLSAERRLFAARALVLAPGAPPPFAAVLAQVRGERTVRARLARAIRRPSPWIALAAAAALAGVFLAQRDGATAFEVLPEPRSNVACYDDTASLVVEAAAYATDRAVASAEDRYAACLVATPAGACAAVAAPLDRDVTCGGLGPQVDAVFEEKARGGSLQ